MLFPRLVQLYKRYGLQVLSSVAPLLWMRMATDKNLPMTALPNDRLFTYIFSEGRLCSGGGGLHMTELYLLESLAEVLSPRRIFVIGNAFGWSTLALSLCFPAARVVAIDSDGAPGGNQGVAFVNDVAADEGLNAAAVLATSPQDVARVVETDLGGPIDLVLIDGDHSNEQQTIDFEACRPVASPDCVYLLHDVLNWDLLPSFKDLVRAHGAEMNATLLTRTASGMAVFYPKSLAERLGPVLGTFVDQFAFTSFTPLGPAPG